MKESDEVQATAGGNPAAYRAPAGTTANNLTNATVPLVLPPNTTLERFQQFMLELGKVTGPDNVVVISKSEELTKDDYRDPSKAHGNPLPFHLCPPRACILDNAICLEEIALNSSAILLRKT